MRLADDVLRDLTQQDYGPRRSIPDVVAYSVPAFAAEDGDFFELIRCSPGIMTSGLQSVEGFSLAQVNFTRIAPRCVKGFHLHHSQTDLWFVPPGDRVLVLLKDCREGASSPIMRVVLGPKPLLLRIPPGVAHGGRNLSYSHDAVLMYFVDRLFTPDPEHTEEHRLPFSYFGADAWEERRD